jgi:hypothetical protein
VPAEAETDISVPVVALVNKNRSGKDVDGDGILNIEGRFSLSLICIFSGCFWI